MLYKCAIIYNKKKEYIFVTVTVSVLFSVIVNRNIRKDEISLLFTYKVSVVQVITFLRNTKGKGSKVE